ncbi:MAG: hypothetical protein EXS36_11450 [Pedosphaera sp.]|nr:hypothetical protein [Pedosphaera sp.]
MLLDLCQEVHWNLGKGERIPKMWVFLIYIARDLPIFQVCQPVGDERTDSRSAVQWLLHFVLSFQA